MRSLIEALKHRVESARRREAPARLNVEMADAPPEVRALTEAMVAHDFHVELGAFSISAGPASVIDSLEDVIEVSLEEVHDLDGVAPGVILAGLLPCSTLLLGADRGGGRAFGLAWSGDRTTIVVVEIEDPTPESVLRRFDEPGAFLAFLRAQLTHDDAGVVDALDALEAKAGAPSS